MATTCLGAWLLPAALAGLFQDPAPQGQPLGPGPAWRGPVRPHGHNEVFATGDGCAMCHSGAERALAMRSATGEDVSPHALWRATMMAQSFRDPYWRAQVAKESAAAPDRAGEIQALCVRCHAPMAAHTARLGGQAMPAVAAMAADPLARDGVSCTVCHQIQEAGLGTPATWSGQPAIERGRTLFGPYAEPRGGPMQMHSRYTPVQGVHVQRSALCASCHTLHTSHVAGAGPFPEQTPYLEWRNSVYSDEDGATATSRTCQQCHMPDFGTTSIARNPGGRDFAIPPREHYRGHAFVGGNAFMLELMAANVEALGIAAPAEALRRMAVATRRQLADQTVQVEVSEPVRADGRLRFDVQVRNLTGHKFPTGYPARRAWLHVQVRAGDDVVFESGAFTAEGAIAQVADETSLPHRTEITAPDEVLVWEMVAEDGDGRPTTYLTRMARRGKDNRLLPAGWRRDGPHADDTAPVGTGTDVDFVAGGDRVAVRVPLAADAPAVTVVAWVHYQSIPPHWVAPLRAVDAEECRAFVRLYDGSDRTPETVGVAVRAEAR